MPLKCLIIGLGQIGMGYDLALDPKKSIFTHARAFSMHSKFDLIGGVDSDKKQRKLFELHYNKPSYSSIKKALEVEIPSIVVISLPTPLHLEAIKEVLIYSKPKIILCEKPLSYNLIEAQEIVSLCENAGVKLFVNYMRRADAGAIEIKERIQSGKIILPVKGIAWYSNGFLHNGSHFFNLLEFWLGSYIKAKILDNGRLWNANDFELDVQVEFEGGVIIFMAAKEEFFSHYAIELISPSGQLRYDRGGKSIEWRSADIDYEIAGYKTLQTKPEMIVNYINKYQLQVLDQLANAIDDKPYSLSSGRQSLTTIKSMYHIIEKRQL